MLIVAVIIVICLIFFFMTKPPLSPKEKRARELAKRARHLNGKQLLGFLSTYAQDEEEMRRALEIIMKKHK